MFDIINKEGKRILYRFLNVKKERSVIIPTDIDELSEYAFSNKDALDVEAIYIPDHITKIPAYCFQKNKATYIRISPNVTHIGDGAFYNCPNLWKATVPPDCKLGSKRWDGVYVNGESVFENSPKHAKSFAPWIYGVREQGYVTIMFESTEGSILQYSRDKQNWTDLPFYRPNLFVADDSGDQIYYRVVAPNTMPTKRNPSKWVAKTRIILL